MGAIVADASERVGRVRKGRREDGFTVVRNDLINHASMSIEARGLLIYLISRPDDWDLRVSDVRRFLGTAGKPCGRDKGYNIIAELKRHHFVVMCDDVDGKHFAGVTYYVFEEPVIDPEDVRRRHRDGEDALASPTGKPLPGKPEADQLSLPDLSHPENQEETKERYIQNTEIPLTPKRRQTRGCKGSGKRVERAPMEQRIVLEPWSVEWVELRIMRLMRGPEVLPPPLTNTLRSIVAKGGEIGERTRLDHQAKHCWPSVRLADMRAEAHRHGCLLPDDIAIDPAALTERYHSVGVDSDEFESWEAAHRQRGWPLMPLPTRATHVWLPKAGIAALNMPNDARTAA
jgi:hypothetical protein